MALGNVLRGSTYSGSRTTPTLASGDLIAEEIAGALTGDKPDGVMANLAREALSTVGNPLARVAASRAERDIMRRYANALRDPKEALRLMELGKINENPRATDYLFKTAPSRGVLGDMYSNFLR